jgi:hypothetical protein
VSSFSNIRSIFRVIIPTVLILITSAYAAAQSSVVTPNTTDVDAIQRRIERARALAAAHQLQLAAVELENVRASVKDVALRNVTTLMLMGIYLEEGTYGRAQTLLDETFQARGAQKDESIRTYFAIAGQTINGIRSHLARYRSYGISLGDSGLPAEAVNDLERVRGLLERMAAQSQEIAKEEGRAYDALALQEDVLGIRLSLARDSEDRSKWQTDYVAAREKLASSQLQVSSLGRSTALDRVTSRIPNPFSSSTTGTARNGTETEPTEQRKDPTATGSETSGVGNGQQSGAPEPQLVSTGSLSGRESKRVTPVYPSLAKTTGVVGTVRVFAIIDEKGKVWVTNSEGPILLRKAAEDAARNWTFPPTIFAGKPARMAGYLDFDFKQ